MLLSQPHAHRPVVAGGKLLSLWPAQWASSALCPSRGAKVTVLEEGGELSSAHAPISEPRSVVAVCCVKLKYGHCHDYTCARSIRQCQVQHCGWHGPCCLTEYLPSLLAV